MSSPQTLCEGDRRLVAAWAADCGERVLPLCLRQKLRRTIALARPLPGPERSPEVRRTRQRRSADASLAGVPAVEVKAPAAAAAARAAGQAVAVCHMGAHALGAAAYAVKAASLATPDRPGVVDDEIRWQLDHMTAEVRAALRNLPPVGENSSGPLGPGLLASGQLREIIAALQSGLATPTLRDRDGT